MPLFPGATPLAIATGTTVNSAAALDSALYTIRLPFTFVFNNTPYDTAYISTNGFITFGALPTSITLSSPIGNSGPYTGAVAGQARDLKGYYTMLGSAANNTDSLYGLASTATLAPGQRITATAIPANTFITAVGSNYVKLSNPVSAGMLNAQCAVATGRIDTATVGLPGTRTFIMQWSGFSTGTSALGAALNFQIRLAEGGGVSAGRMVSVVYGPEVGHPTATALATGIRGVYHAGGGYFSNRGDAAPVTNANWSATTAGSSSGTTVTFRDTVKPASGLTFTWTPSGPCAVSPQGVTAGSVTGSTASISWTPVSGISSYTLEYGPGAFALGTGTKVYGLTSPACALSGLNAGTVYRAYVRSVCSATDSGDVGTPAVFSSWISNDSASAAVMLAVNGGCNTAQYNNTGASHTDSIGGQPYEPTGTINSTRGHKTMYFKFRAPASGAVRISTDYAGGTLTDTRLTLFSVTDSSDYSTFTEITSDEDNGSVVPNNSVIFATDLVAGQTYYVQVGNFSAVTNSGTYCLTIDSLTGSMLSTGAALCQTGLQPFGGNNDYRGWVSLVDSSSRLIALVRQPFSSSASVVGISTSLTVHTGAVRREYDSAGRFYLNRNYKINWSASNVEVRLFFTKAELDSLAAKDGVSLSPSSLTIMRQSGIACTGVFDSSAGTEQMLTRTGSGLADGVGWVAFTAPAFSNFYLMGGATALPLLDIDVQARRQGGHNRISWKVTGEEYAAHYALERSANAAAFEAIASYGGGAAEYAHEDQTPLPGRNYYRVRSTAADGHRTWSRVVMVQPQYAPGFAVEAFPNPAGERLTVRVSGMEGSTTLTISDAAGRVLKRLAPTGVETAIDLSELPAGLYLLRYADSAHTTLLKVGKE